MMQIVIRDRPTCFKSRKTRSEVEPAETGMIPYGSSECDGEFGSGLEEI